MEFNLDALLARTGECVEQCTASASFADQHNEFFFGNSAEIKVNGYAKNLRRNEHELMRIEFRKSWSKAQKNPSPFK